ncbi:hypothetical protein Tco_0972847 [Tanacetum coccineum]
MTVFLTTIKLASFIYKQNRTNHKDQQTCLFACFLSHEEPKKVISNFSRWKVGLKRLQKNCFNSKLQDGCMLVRLWFYYQEQKALRLVAQGTDKRKVVDFDESVLHQSLELKQSDLLFGHLHLSVGTSCSIRWDVKSAFLYGIITEDGLHSSPKSMSSMVKDFEDLMQKEFKMSSMGELTFFLGIQVKQTSAGIFLSQGTNMEKMKKGEDVDVIFVGTLDSKSTIDFGFILHEHLNSILTMRVSYHFIVKNLFSTKSPSILDSNITSFEIVMSKGSLCYKSKVHTDDNVADLLTKGFDLARFNFLVIAFLRSYLGTCSDPDLVPRVTPVKCCSGLCYTLNRTAEVQVLDTSKRTAWKLTVLRSQGDCLRYKETQEVTLSHAKLIRKAQGQTQEHVKGGSSSGQKHHVFWVEKSSTLQNSKKSEKEAKRSICLQSNGGWNKEEEKRCRYRSIRKKEYETAEINVEEERGLLSALENTYDVEVARKIQAEWNAEEERKRFEELKKAKPKTTLRKPTTLAQERNQMMNFLKGQGYKNLQKLKYPQMKELDEKRLLRKRKATISEEQPSKKVKLRTETVDELRNYLRIVDFEKNTQDRESLEGISMITELQVIDSPDGDYLIIHRANNHLRAFDTLWEILHILDRQDLYHLYRVVQDYYEHIPPTGLGLILLAERRYPLSRELMIRMLEHGMEVEDESETAITLIHLFILWTTANGDNS